jgi:F-type H+-transporting ATPase subunit delta
MTAFARSYAQAFLQTAPKDYDVERFLEGAAAIRDALAQDARLKAFFSSPAVPLPAKSGALAQLAARAGVDPFGTRLLNLVLAHRRILGLSEILSAIREQSDRAAGVVAARVTVAAPVDEAEQARIAEALGRSVKRRVRLKMDVDERILGGFVAQVGSEIFDASVRHAVERFQKQTKEGENARA